MAIRLQSKYGHAAKQPAFVFICQQRVIQQPDPKLQAMLL
jgi:hypothetical protein